MAKHKFLASTFVTIYANRRVIRVPTHAAVMGIRTLLVRVRRIPRVTCIDTGKDCVIRGIDMAVAATRTIVWNPERRVIKNRAQPGSRYPSGVAGNASGWIGRGHVVRHVRPVILSRRVVGLMASITIRGWIARGVVAADMAVGAGIHHRSDRAGNGCAWRQHVRTLQRESRCRVVKLSVGPQNCVVTRRAHGS